MELSVRQARAVASPKTECIGLRLKLLERTRCNVLLAGDPGQLHGLLTQLLAHVSSPLVWWHTGLPMPATAIATVIIQEVGTLSAENQQLWLGFLDASGNRAPRLITTSSCSLFALVEQGAFLDRLYYRLNTVLLDSNGVSVYP
jgi:hypothetical protein